MLSISEAYANEFSSFANSAQRHQRGRPAGDLRIAVTTVIKASGPVTLRDLIGQIQATPSTLASTLNNMVRDGRLVKCGMERRPHAKRWVAVYDAPDTEYDEAPIFPARDLGVTALQSALQGWTTPHQEACTCK